MEEIVYNNNIKGDVTESKDIVDWGSGYISLFGFIDRILMYHNPNPKVLRDRNIFGKKKWGEEKQL